MRMSMKKVVIGLVLMSAMACSKKENKDELALKLFSESMEMHDQIMPLMDEMYKLERKLKSLRDSLRTDSVSNRGKLYTLTGSLNKLQVASKGMMDWMHNIKDVPRSMLKSDHGNHSQPDNHSDKEISMDTVLRVQQEQKAAIELVREAMENSIEEARNVVSSKKE